MPPDESGVSQLDLREYLRTLRRRKYIVLASLVVVVGVALGLSYSQKKQYAASAKLLLRSGGSQSVFSSDGQSGSTSRSVQTQIEVIKTEPVQDLVRQKIGYALPVEVSPIGQTDLIVIRAVSTAPKRAAETANAYATAYIDFRRTQTVDDLAASGQELDTKIAQFQKQIDDLNGQIDAAPLCVDSKTTAAACAQRDNIVSSVGARRTALLNQQALFRQRLEELQVNSALASGGAQLVTPASTPAVPFAPTPRRSGILGAFFGLMLGVGLAFLVEYLDDSIKGKEDFERAVPGLSVLGMIPAIPDWKPKDEGRVISLSEPNSSAAEAYRIVRTSIQFLGLDRTVRIIQVTSANAQEGKTTTVANMAVAFARSGLRTIAVCCDLRRPRLHEFFDMTNEVGFTSVLLGNVALSKALRAVPGQERLLILPSGTLPPNPSELLAGRRAADLLQNLSGQADIVILDSPPTLPVTDALVLSQRVDATVVVASASTTTRHAAVRAYEMLSQVNAPVVGAILNGVRAESGYEPYTYRTDGVLASAPRGSRNGSRGQRVKRGA